MSRNTNKTPNRALWQARQRSELPQKAVAFLLGHRFTDLISQYERGEILPSLSVALKLEIIYKVPIRLLFQNQYQAAIWQIRERSSEVATLMSHSTGGLHTRTEQFNEESYCHYQELLGVPNLPVVERERVRAHAVKLVKQLQSNE